MYHTDGTRWAVRPRGAVLHAAVEELRGASQPRSANKTSLLYCSGSCEQWWHV